LAVRSADAQIPNFPPASSQPTVKIERGSEVSLVLAEPVSSATAKKGQMVRMELAEPWVVEGHLILPKGTPAEGIVGSVEHAVQGKKTGRVVITAGSIQLPTGRSLHLRLALPDQEDCDGAKGACAAVAGIFVLVTSPIVAIEGVVLLVESPVLIHKAIHEHKGQRKSRIAATDSLLPVGTQVRAWTTRTRVLVPIDPDRGVATK